MFKCFYPDVYTDSAYGIDYAGYYKMGYRGILFDVDNTLVEHDEPVTERAVKLISMLRGIGFSVCIISNNKEPRVKPLADVLGSQYVSKAGKPSAKGYVQGMRQMDTEPSTTIFVGDQIFTDVWGANRAGIFSILVKPIAKHEEIQIVLKRQLERIVLFFYRTYQTKK